MEHNNDAKEEEEEDSLEEGEDRTDDEGLAEDIKGE